MSLAPDVSVVIVSYNTRDVLDACLRALLASRGVRIDALVVDNASPDGSADHVARAFPDVTLFRNPENRGFAAANNVALRHARGRAALLLNPDTIVRPDTVARLVAALDARPDVGIIGPRVLNDDGTPQSCGYWYPTLAGEILQSRLGRGLRVLAPNLASRHAAHASAPSARAGTGASAGATMAAGTRTSTGVGAAMAAGAAASAVADVEWVDGCCLMIRRAAMEHIGLLDEQFFLYAEELDWCRRARTAGWRVVTFPEAAMIHLGGQSSEQVKASALALLVETRLRYYRKHDGLFTALAVGGVYALGCAATWRREPEKARAKLRGVAQWWRALRGRPTARPAPVAGFTVGGRGRA